MSLKIIKAGLLDTVQDGGRYGYASLGIPPCGPMDTFSASLANSILGKDLNEPVLEFHFPAPVIEINSSCITAFTGADLSPLVNGVDIPLCQPVFIPEGSILEFKRPVKGSRAYMALFPGMEVPSWLGSRSTDQKARAGGVSGRQLKTGDEIRLTPLQSVPDKKLSILPWNSRQTFQDTGIRVLPGPEWDLLNEESKRAFYQEEFRISNHSDRMGCRLIGPALRTRNKEEQLSSAVSMGTIQLLPSGDLIVLMADHPTTGGYPRIASVTGADLGRFAQLLPGFAFRFSMTDILQAEELYLAQFRYLDQLKALSRAEMLKYLK